MNFLLGSTVKNEYEITSEGKLDKPAKYYLSLGFSFEVDRDTGKIVGGGFDDAIDYQRKVVDSGDNGSFKVFSFSESRNIAESLVIKTLSKENGKTPFIYVDFLQRIFTGTCD